MPKIMKRCPVCGDLMLRKNVARHINVKAAKGDRAHEEELRRRAGELPEDEKPRSKSTEKGEKPRQGSSTEKTRTPPPPELKLSAVPSTTPQEAQEVGELEFPEEGAPQSYEGVEMGPPVPYEVPYQNWENLLETIWDMSLAFREGDLAALGKMTQHDYEVLARAIARSRGQDLDDRYVLWLAGAKFFLLVAANIFIGLEKVFRKAKERKAADLAKKAAAAKEAAARKGNSEAARVEADARR